MIGYNKICNVEDFSDPDFMLDMRAIYAAETIANPAYPAGDEFRKNWEVVQAVRGLRAFGAIRRDATLLGVGAGHEHTIWHLSNLVEMVHATDMYLMDDFWDEWAPRDMMIAPEQFATCPYDAQRVVIQHMDGRVLRYPDNYFDGIFSSSSIEHFGTLDEIAQAAAEMGRVLKPGGVLSISTEVRLNDQAGNGWGNVCVFHPETLDRYILKPSGCELAEPIDWAVTESTLACVQDLDMVVANVRTGKGIARPHVSLSHQGYVFTSLSLTLVKPS